MNIMKKERLLNGVIRNVLIRSVVFLKFLRFLLKSITVYLVFVRFEVTVTYEISYVQRDYEIGRKGSLKQQTNHHNLKQIEQHIYTRISWWKNFKFNITSCI